MNTACIYPGKHRLVADQYAPPDWRTVRIGDFCQCYAGGTPLTSNRAYYDGDIPWITSQDLNSKYLFGVTGRISARGLRESSAKMVTPKTLLIAMYGATAGVAAITYIEAAINQAVLAIVPDKTIADTRYLFHLLRLQRPQLIGSFTQGGQPNLSGKIIKAFVVSLPPLIEQLAIANALSDVDALLDALDRQIAKQRDLKQAAVQQLLTGRTRLPGFTAPWEHRNLGSLGIFLRGKGVRREEAQGGTLPCVRYGEIYTQHSDVVREFYSWISPAVAATATRMHYGDLLFTSSGEKREEIGKCVAFVENREAYAGGDIIILRAHNMNPVFMSYYCNAPHVIEQKTRRGQGDAVVHIGINALADISVALPTLSEQSAIAQVLSDMDTQIAALEARRAKTAAIKQGMMQELLTGRTRLV